MAVVQCTVDSEPPAEMTLSRDGKVLATSHGAHGLAVGTGHVQVARNALQLRVQNVPSRDKDTYVCMARNSLGSVSTMGQLQPEGEQAGAGAGGQKGSRDCGVGVHVSIRACKGGAGWPDLMERGWALPSLGVGNGLALGELPARGGVEVRQCPRGAWVQGSQNPPPCHRRAQSGGGSIDLPWGSLGWEERRSSTLREPSLRNEVQPHPWGIQSEGQTQPHPSKV